MSSITIIGGWGIYDCSRPYNWNSYESGKKVSHWCPVFRKWASIIERSKSSKFKQRNPTYLDTDVCEEWKHFSVFERWLLQEQPNKNWENCQPDKDLLVVGNKIYSPETTVLVTAQVNGFIGCCNKARGVYMLGVSPCKLSKRNPYQSHCRSPFSKDRGYLGLFPTELEAHLAWQTKKHEYACQLADLQDDRRVAKALRERYAPDKDWTNR